jgi:inner membrane protein
LIMGFVASWTLMKLTSVESKHRWKLVLYFFIVTLSHPLLDACTTGGLGVAFFSPFSNQSFFFPYHPIKVSPIEVNSFFSDWGLKVLLSEFIWIGLPTMAVMTILSLMRKKR